MLKPFGTSSYSNDLDGDVLYVYTKNRIVAKCRYLIKSNLTECYEMYLPKSVRESFRNIPLFLRLHYVTFREQGIYIRLHFVLICCIS